MSPEGVRSTCALKGLPELMCEASYRTVSTVIRPSQIVNLPKSGGASALMSAHLHQKARHFCWRRSSLLKKLRKRSLRNLHGDSGMTENKLARLDAGETNRRILNKEESRQDFRRVEAASLKRRTKLQSAEGKRLFVRCFYSFQASMYFISAMGRTKLPHEAVEEIEGAVRKKLEDAAEVLNRAIDQAEVLLKSNNIESVATYDTVAMEEEVGITSALGRRYFELFHKLDQLMPLMQTLQIEEVITEREEEKQRSTLKRVILSITSSARNFNVGVRRRMNDVDRAKLAEEALKSAPGQRGAAVELVAVETSGDGQGATPAQLAAAEMVEPGGAASSTGVDAVDEPAVAAAA